MKAASIGHIDIARLLLKKGADVDAKDNDGSTALMWAVRRGHIELKKLLGSYKRKVVRCCIVS